MSDEDIRLKLAAGPKRSYIITSSGQCICKRDPQGGQTYSPFWETEEETIFHDEVLKKATQEINEILDKVSKENTDNKRVLSIIQYQNTHLLVWATLEDIVTPDDDEATVTKALKLKK
jgi:hypothetical protein